MTVWKEIISKGVERKFLLFENDNDYSALSFVQIHPNIKKLMTDVLVQGYDVEIGYLPLDSGILLARDLEANIDFEPEEVTLNSTRISSGRGNFFLMLEGTKSAQKYRMAKRVSSDFFVGYWNLTHGKRILKTVRGESFRGSPLEVEIYKDGRDLVLGRMHFPSSDKSRAVSPIGKDVSTDEKYQDKNLAR
jgi:hypothetical protein